MGVCVKEKHLRMSVGVLSVYDEIVVEFCKP